ncbi:MAG: hypothetical protein ACI9LM_000551 [Alteromonadaceae bacterium]|jgi:hypothetical protein
MNIQQVNTLVSDLYLAVDNKDVDYLKRNLAENVNFRIANNPLLTNKADILAANSQFFSSVESMNHTIENVIYLDDTTNDITKLSCHGQVIYVRLDGTKHSAVFSTFLSVKKHMIIDYLVFADISGL